MSENLDISNNDELIFNSNRREKLLRYLDSVLEGIFEEENAVKLNIKMCENKLKEAQNTIEIAEKQVDPNGIFFTPQVGQRTKFNRSINDELINLSNELDSYNLKKRAIEEKKLNVIEVISYINEISNDSISISNISVESSPENMNYSLSEEMHIKMLETQENERNRIARDIHDTTVQNLTSLIHKAELCTKLVDRDSIRTKLELQTMISTVRNTIDDLRMIIYDLRPMSIDDLGLIATIERHVDNLKFKENIDINLQVDGVEHMFQSIVNLTIFRVIQEACNNIIKHAEASSIDIFIKYRKNDLEVIIEDDGIGFTLDEVSNKTRDDLSGLGISIMKERVFLLSGNILFFNKDTGGTKIVITVPYFNENE